MMEKRKIFVVEDDLVLLETLQDILVSSGYECDECRHTNDAVKLIENYRPDLIFLDYMLPEWNGGELCNAIRGINSSLIQLTFFHFILMRT